MLDYMLTLSGEVILLRLLLYWKLTTHTHQLHLFYRTPFSIGIVPSEESLKPPMVQVCRSGIIHVCSPPLSQLWGL